jgi:hypothetical protein
MSMAPCGTLVKSLILLRAVHGLYPPSFLGLYQLYCALQPMYVLCIPAACAWPHSVCSSRSNKRSDLRFKAVLVL